MVVEDEEIEDSECGVPISETAVRLASELSPVPEVVVLVRTNASRVFARLSSPERYFIISKQENNRVS